MVYVDSEELRWLPYVQTFMAKYNKRMKEETREFLMELFTKYVDQGLKFVNKKCTQGMQQVDFSKVVTLCKLLEALVLGSSGQIDLSMDPAKLHPILCTTFIFCYLWAIGGNIIDANWDAFDTFIRQIFEDNPDAKVSGLASQ